MNLDFILDSDKTDFRTRVIMSNALHKTKESIVQGDKIILNKETIYL